MTGDDLPIETTIENGEEGWQGRRPYDRERTIHLFFVKSDNGYSVYAWGSAFPQDGGGLPRGRINVSDREVRGAIDDLRAIWQQHVLDRVEIRQGQKFFPFIDDWNVTPHLPQAELDAIWLDLARAGNHLF